MRLKYQAGKAGRINVLVTFLFVKGTVYGLGTCHLPRKWVVFASGIRLSRLSAIAAVAFCINNISCIFCRMYRSCVSVPASIQAVEQDRVLPDCPGLELRETYVCFDIYFRKLFLGKGRYSAGRKRHNRCLLWRP